MIRCICYKQNDFLHYYKPLASDDLFYHTTSCAHKPKVSRWCILLPKCAGLLCAFDRDINNQFLMRMQPESGASHHEWLSCTEGRARERESSGDKGCSYSGGGGVGQTGASVAIDVMFGWYFPSRCQGWGPMMLLNGEEYPEGKRWWAIGFGSHWYQKQEKVN